MGSLRSRLVMMMAAVPICLHADNPHYLLFRGRPTVLVASGEHYGAVLNLDFDYVRYLDALARSGLNLTRTFSGMYREVPGSFGIEANTLAPAPGRWACPWARSGEPGAADGGAKFDLARWDDAYFARLRDFVAQAGRRGIVVELVVFCVFYDDGLWDLCPMRAGNNVQGIGDVGRLEPYGLKDEALTAVEERLARKLVEELAGFDNVYFEVCNEPYFGGVTPEWTARIARALRDAGAGVGLRHLIAENIANEQAEVRDPQPDVSILNFHYAHPEAVALNYGLGRPIADDETGFKGTADEPYRREAWEFMMSGGAIVSNLDYSFSCQRPDGTAEVKTSPGGGGPEMRRQLAVLKRFVESFDFLRLRPGGEAVRGVGCEVHALVEPGRQYAAYVRGDGPLAVEADLPAGRYRVEWLDVLTGQRLSREDLTHAGGACRLAAPPAAREAALRLRAIAR